MKKKLIESKGKIIGAVINNLEPDKEDRYFYYHYNYGKDHILSPSKEIAP
ncbi:MAG: hypothetical protein NTW13_02460 [Candidatus Omnitrophica bacterium]|nr:hypothetical protein [Candidatus Omnitrophota bacterium]